MSLVVAIPVGDSAGPSGPRDTASACTDSVASVASEESDIVVGRVPELGQVPAGDGTAPGESAGSSAGGCLATLGDRRYQLRIRWASGRSMFALPSAKGLARLSCISGMLARVFTQIQHWRRSDDARTRARGSPGPARVVLAGQSSRPAAPAARTALRDPESPLRRVTVVRMLVGHGIVSWHPLAAVRLSGPDGHAARVDYDVGRDPGASIGRAVPCWPTRCGTRRPALHAFPTVQGVQVRCRLDRAEPPCPHSRCTRSHRPYRPVTRPPGGVAGSSRSATLSDAVSGRRRSS